MNMRLFCRIALVLLSPLISVSSLQASIKCSAILVDNTTGVESKVELTLASGDELRALGYEKSDVTGAKVRSSEVYAVISAGQFGVLILEIPNLRAERGIAGYVTDARTFQEIVTRRRIHPKSFNTEGSYSLELLVVIP